MTTTVSRLSVYLVVCVCVCLSLSLSLPFTFTEIELNGASKEQNFLNVFL